MADDIQTATPDPVPTPAQLAAAAPEAPAVQANPEVVAHSDSLLTKVARDLENSKLVVAAEQAKQQALLAVVADTKAGIDKLHSELTAFTSAIKVEEQKVVNWTETHKTKVALIVIAVAVLAWLVVTKL
jgi:septal ring factor EnvC (AmiA/AmiB activator)